MDFITPYLTVAVVWYVAFFASIAVAALSQFVVVLWRYIDDTPDTGFWFIPEKYRRYWDRPHPARSWSMNSEADDFTVIMFLVCGVGGLLWPAALVGFIIFAPAWVLRALRRGQKKINAIVELAHRHPDGSSTPADVGRLSLR